MAPGRRVKRGGKTPQQPKSAKKQKTSQKQVDPTPTTSRQLTSAEREAAIAACLNNPPVVRLGACEIFRQASVPMYPEAKFSEIRPGTCLHSGRHNFDLVADAEGHLNFNPGDIIVERYKLEVVMGQGAFGKVVKAYDIRTKQNVAIKITGTDEEACLCAEDEISALQKLNAFDPDDTRAWVKMIDSFKFWGHCFIVLELLAEDLFIFMQKRNDGFQLNQVRDIAAQILWAIDGLQCNMIMHTDLKTKNICLVDVAYGPSYSLRRERVASLSSTKVKIVDFGLAISLNFHERPQIQTRFYRCPEVIFAMKWGYPSDVWSVGCILFEIYTGVLLFPVATDAEHIGAMETILGPLPSMYSSIRYYQRMLLELKRYPNRTQFKPLRAYMKIKAMEHEAFFDLLAKLLEMDPNKRITPKDALRHRFFYDFRQGR